MKAYFTIEMGRGATYNSNKPTVYKYDEYPDYSVLAGQVRRSYLGSFDTVEEAKKFCPEAELSGCGFVELDLGYLPDDELNDMEQHERECLAREQGL